MIVEYPDFAQDANTLVAVGAGAVLATIGGFVGSRLEARLHRAHLQRTAALIFGEILASLRVMVRAIDDAHSRGDPFGPLTLRLLRGARREVDAYERSRLALSDVRSAEVRLAIHALMIRFALAIDGILETTGTDRDQAYEYLLSLLSKVDPLVNQLLPLAGQPVSPYDELSHDPTGRPVSPSSSTST